MTVTTFELRDRFSADRGDIAIGGMHAIVRTIIDQRRADRRAGLRTAGLISGYPGSPVGGLDAVIGQQRAILAELDVRFVPGLNEELGATAVWGSQVANVIGTGKYDGVLGMWYGKAPGLDRASDAIREANWVGVGEFGGALAVVGDDPQNKSSALPSASELTLADLELPVVYPGSVAEVIALGRYAVRAVALLRRLVGVEDRDRGRRRLPDRRGCRRAHLRTARVHMARRAVEGDAAHHAAARAH